MPISYRLTAFIFVFLIPVCAVDILPAVFGNFSRNASILLLLPLVLFLFLYVGGRNLFFSFVENKAYRWIVLSLVYSLVIHFMTTTYFASVNWQGVGDDLWGHALVRAMIPVFLILLVSCGYWLVKLDEQGFRSAIKWSFIFFVGYSYIQALAMLFDFTFLDRLFMLMESGKGLAVPYMRDFHRLNSSTLEPAEFCRVLIIWFYPLILRFYGLSTLLFSMFLTFPLLVLSYSTSGLVVWLVFCVSIIFAFSYKGRFWAGFIGLLLVLISISFDGVLDYLYFIYDKISDVDGSESTRTRYAMLYASWHLLVDYFWFGIGWSREVFILEDYFPLWGLNWETRQAFENADAISAKSQVVRMLVNNGVFFIAVYFLGLFYIYAQSSKTGRLQTVVPFLVVYVIYNLIDGGIITSFYPWVVLGVIIMFSRGEYERKNP